MSWILVILGALAGTVVALVLCVEVFVHDEVCPEYLLPRLLRTGGDPPTIHGLQQRLERAAQRRSLRAEFQDTLESVAPKARIHRLATLTTPVLADVWQLERV